MGTRANTEPALQALQPPGPWKLKYHALRDVDPETIEPGDPIWEWFGDNLLLVKHPGGILVEVGWRPEGSPDGRFQLVVIRDDDWAHPLERWHTRSLTELISRLETIWVRFREEPIPELSTDQVLAAIRDAVDPRDAQSRVGWLADHRAVEGLVRLLSDPRPQVRFAAVRALTSIADPDTGDALLTRFLLPDPDLDTRRALIVALGAVRHAPAIPVLIRWLKNPDPDQRGAAANALVALEAVEALPALTEALATERRRALRPQLKTALQNLARMSGARKRAAADEGK